MQYVGIFEIENENITFLDPMTVGISSEFYSMNIINMASLRIDNIPNGIWYAYQLYDTKQQEPVGLLLTLKGNNPSEIKYEDILSWRYEGKVCCSIAKTICCADNQYIDSNDFAYTVYDDNVIYKLTELKDWCKHKMGFNKNQQDLLSFINQELNNGEKYIEAAKIVQYLKDTVPVIETCNLWSIDCMNKCSNVNMSAATIKNGVVSKCTEDFASIYCRDDNTAIYVSTNSKKEPYIGIR